MTKPTRITVPDNFGQELRKQRNKTGMGIVSFAKAYGFAPSTLHDLEIGRYKTTDEETIVKLRNIFIALNFKPRGYAFHEPQNKGFLHGIKQFFKWKFGNV